MSNSGTELYFEDPRLRMMVVGRAVVRIIVWAVNVFLIALAAVLLVAGDPRLVWSGVLLALFLLHKALHAGKGTRSLDTMPAEGRYNVSPSLVSSAFALLESSFDRAFLTGIDVRVTLLSKLFIRKETKEAFIRLEVAPKEFLAEAERIFGKHPKKLKSEMQEYYAHVAPAAARVALSSHEHYIEPHDVLAGMFMCGDEEAERLLSLFSLSAESVRIALVFGNKRSWWRRMFSRRELWGRYPRRVRHRAMNRAWTARPTPTLDRFADDLTDMARAGAFGFLVGHDAEYSRLLDVLSRPASPAALLVGEPGIGKEAILQHLAFNIVKDRVPPVLFDKRLVRLHIGEAVAGLAPHEAQERIQGILSEIARAGNVILYIPDIDILARTGGKEFLSVADVLAPTLHGGRLPVIGTAAPRAYKQYIERRDDFKTLFDVINIEELNEDEAGRYLAYTALGFEAEYGVTITLGAIRKAVLIAHKHFRQKPLPVSAEDVLKEAVGEAVRRGELTVRAATIVAIAERRVNIPLHDVSETEAETLIDMERVIHERYIDQDEAVGAVSRVLREYRSGLTQKGGPIASFLFVGPTGVGKTELSKILSELQFGSKDAMVRFDMSEFQERDSIARFIGSPDGAITGALTDAVLAKPYSVVLLDEFEKAHKDILNLFLQVFDEGRLTDGLGRRVDFVNTIIIATSNAASKFVLEALQGGMSASDVADEMKRRLTKHFRPELLNRFSGIIVFRALSRDDIVRITDLQLAEFARDAAEAKKITLTFTPEVKAKIAELGYSPAYGARPLRRVIEEKLRSALAEAIIRRELEEGDAAEVRYENGEFVYNPAPFDRR